MQRGRQQQPTHNDERLGVLDADAAMRSIAPQIHAWRLTREVPHRRLHELKRAHDASVKLLGRRQWGIGWR